MSQQGDPNNAELGYEAPSSDAAGTAPRLNIASIDGGTLALVGMRAVGFWMLASGLASIIEQLAFAVLSASNAGVAGFGFPWVLTGILYPVMLMAGGIGLLFAPASVLGFVQRGATADFAVGRTLLAVSIAVFAIYTITNGAIEAIYYTVMSLYVADAQFMSGGYVSNENYGGIAVSVIRVLAGIVLLKFTHVIAEKTFPATVRRG